MDPTHFISGQSLHRNDLGKLSPDEIDAFYHRHGLDLFDAISRWRARMGDLWQRIHDRQDPAADFASGPHRG